MSERNMTLFVQRLTPTATPPRRAEEGSVGYDLHADADALIMPGKRALVSTGIAVAIPAGCYGRVAPRSGLAVKHGLDVLAGVVDPSYRGSVGVVLINTGDVQFEVRRGDRIAQLVIERCETPDVSEVDSLPETARGAGGFGSTGR